jgi:nicotinate-nucleotide pyrophosphorylase (carboxylating)
MRGIDGIIERALEEDIHTGDVTTAAVVPQAREITGRLVAKEPLVLAGLSVAARVFALVDPAIRFTPQAADGDQVEAGTVIAKLAILHL